MRRVSGGEGLKVVPDGIPPWKRLRRVSSGLNRCLRDGRHLGGVRDPVGCLLTRRPKRFGFGEPGGLSIGGVPTKSSHPAQMIRRASAEPRFRNARPSSSRAPSSYCVVRTDLVGRNEEPTLLKKKAGFRSRRRLRGASGLLDAEKEIPSLTTRL